MFSKPAWGGRGAALRLQVSAAGLLFVLLVGAIWAVSLWRSRADAIGRAEARAANLSLLLAGNVASVFERAEIALGETASQLERELAGPGIDRHALWALVDAGTALVPAISRIGVFDEAGHQICGQPLERCQQLEVADREYFIELRSHPGNETSVWGPYVSRVDGRSTLVLARALRHPDGRFAGVVIALVPLSHFAELLAAADLGRGGAAALRGPDLGLFLRSPPLDSMLPAAPSDDLRRAVQASPAQGSFRGRGSADGIERQSAYQRLERHGLYVAVGLATREFLAPWRQQALWMYALFLLFASCAFLIVRLMLIGERDRWRIQQFADELETRVEQRTRDLRRLAAELDAAESRERRQLSRDLHDDLGQTLAAARIHLGALSNSGEAQVREVAARVGELIARANRSTRSLAVQLAPPMLDDLGLPEALEWLGEEIERSFGLKVSVVDDGQPKQLSPEARSILYRATRELLINAAKHAQAESAEVEIERVGGSIVVRVRDCGVGFDPQVLAAAKGQGLGLLSVRERLAFIGGSAELASLPGDGTLATLTAPLADAASEA